MPTFREAASASRVGADATQLTGNASAQPHMGTPPACASASTDATAAIALERAPINSPPLMHAVSWQLVYRLDGIWQRVRSRCPSAVSFTLRTGLSLDQLGRAPAALIGRLPRAVVASLMIHDGQIDSELGVGMLFAGSRLLSLAEIATVGPPGDGALPLTTTVGFQHVAARADGAILLQAGFNEHVKAASWASFMERMLWDTI